MCGIYKITNNINKKVYIGQSICIEKRWKRHYNETRNINSSSYDYPLYRAIRKYGLENFSFEILEECETTKLNEKEIFWISFYKSNYPNKGYNLTSGGSHSAPIKLTFQEVDEIINLLKNSYFSQKEIAEKFNVSQSIISGISMGELWRKQEEIYPLREKNSQRNIKKMKNYCIDCGKEITLSAKRCNICKGEKYRKVERPSREELKFLIRKYPFTKIAERYSVTDNAVRKWCDKYKLPRKMKEIKSYSEEEWVEI